MVFIGRKCRPGLSGKSITQHAGRTGGFLINRVPYSPATSDLHDIRISVRTAGATDCPLSNLGKDNLHAENP